MDSKGGEGKGQGKRQGRGKGRGQGPLYASAPPTIQVKADWETALSRQLTNQEWNEHFAYTIVEKGEEQLPLFQVLFHPSFNWYEKHEWVNVYREWQIALAYDGPGTTIRFPDRPWMYEVTILSDDEWWAWNLPEGWGPFRNEALIVGWQRNLTKSPWQKRPIRRIDSEVPDFYQRDLKPAD